MRQLRPILFALLLASPLFASPIYAHSQTVDARQRLAELANATSLVREGTKPWHLAMSFDLYDLAGKLKESGTAEEWWVSPSQRRLVITSPSLNLTIPGSASEKPDTANREAFLVHNLIEQVVNPIPNFEEKEALSFEQETKSFGKIKLSCLDVTRIDTTTKEKPLLPGPIFCLNPGSDVLRAVFESGEDLSILRNRLGRFRDISVAQDDTLSYYGNIAISGKVTALESYDPQVSPVGPMTVDHPSAVVPDIILAGKIIKKIPPSYPGLAKSEHLSGTVILLGVISKEGKIKTLDVLSSPSPILSNAAVDAVKQWEYQPYLLNGAPTEVQTTLTVNFKLNNNQRLTP